MISRAQRLGALLLAVVFGVLAFAKLVDADGYAYALASFSIVEEERAWEAGTLLAAVEACAATLLFLVALAGRHAIVAFQGGALLAMSASLAYAILVVSAFYEEQDLARAALFGTLLRHERSPYVIVEVLVLLSCSAWLLTSAFLAPDEAHPHRPPRRRKRRRRPAPDRPTGRRAALAPEATRAR